MRSNATAATQMSEAEIKATVTKVREDTRAFVGIKVAGAIERGDHFVDVESGNGVYDLFAEVVVDVANKLKENVADLQFHGYDAEKRNGHALFSLKSASSRQRR